MNKKSFLIASAFSTLLLPACSQTDMTQSSVHSSDINAISGVRVDSSEDLLAAQGRWSLIEEQGAKEPLGLHSSARMQVNPSNRSKKQFIPESRLANIAGTKGEQDIRFRLLKLEQTGGRTFPPVQDFALASSEHEDESFDIAAIPEKKPDYIKKAASVSPASGVTASVSVKRIRFGEHPGKTRLVLDLSGESTYRADINNQDRILIIELDNAEWDVARREIMQHPLVAGYSAQPSQAGGTSLALKLKKSVKIVGSAALKPNDSRGHRIYLDLASG